MADSGGSTRAVVGDEPATWDAGPAIPAAALDALGPAVVVYGPDDRLIHANRNLLSFFPDLAPLCTPGRSLDEIVDQIARSDYFAVQPEDRALFRSRLLTPREMRRREVQLADGRWLYIEDSPVPGGGRVVSYTDISDLKRREADLRAREERLDYAMKAAADGVWDWDVTAGTVYYSPRWKELLGYRPDELPDTWETWRERTHPADLERVEARTRQAVEDGSPAYDTEFRMRHRDGSWRSILSRVHIIRDESGRAVRMVGTHTDITELRAVGERAARTADRLAEAERLADLGSWERDALGTEQWSAGLRALLGVGPEAVPSRAALLASVHPDDRQRADMCFDGGGRCLLRVNTADGSQRQVLASAKAVTDDRGRTVRVVGTWLDVTRTRAVEDRATRAEVHLLSAIETVADGIVLLDPEKRIVLVNSRYADHYPGFEEMLEPGCSFPAFLAALRERGAIRWFDGMPGDADWVSPRLGEIGHRTEPLEMQLDSGRWYQVRETRTADDYTLLVRTDITDMKLREAALTESRARFRAMFDNSVQFIGQLSPDGRVLAVNQTALSFIGGREEDLIGRWFWETPWWNHDRTQQDLLRDALTEAATGEAVRFEATHPSADGTLHVVDVSIKPVRDADGRVTMLIPEGRDITAQRKAEQALADNMRFVQALADTAQMPIYAHDARGRYVFCNDAFLLAVGRPAREVIGRSVFHASLRETGVDVQQINRDLLAAGGSVTYEARATLGDGSVRDMIVSKTVYFGSDGDPEGIVAVLTDISRQKEAERRFGDYARSSGDWFWEMDRMGRFTYVSDRVGDTTGLRAADLIGLSRDDLMDPTWNPAGIAAYHHALEQRQPVRDFVYRTVDIRGRVHFIRVNAVPVHDATGRFIGFRGTGSEVTALTQAEADLRAAKEAAEVASRAKTEFLAAMGHELRTPLNAIIGFSEVMGMQALGPLGNETYLEYARDIRLSGEHLLALVNDVLDASRIDSGRMELTEEEVDLARLGKAVEQLALQRSLDAGVALAVDVVDGLPPFRADERRLKQVFVNLLSNAVKFTEAGGAVSLVIDRDEDGCLSAVVSDTGIGMSAADLARIQHRFTQIDSSLGRKYEGMGLGLSLAKDIVELHGGSLGISSTPGIGTTVTVVLPAGRFAEG
ncbi:PAS domain S-box protein [Caenispirillum bisanense]|uniref:PAS domain S-box protein n=1 Tax=Caenispirillum bisanense TaxID=414052 RepID=UPI0015968828|nr:PAS domain S-box protein [Caenispirillum bisanense]